MENADKTRFRELFRRALLGNKRKRAENSRALKRSNREIVRTAKARLDEWLEKGKYRDNETTSEMFSYLDLSSEEFTANFGLRFSATFRAWRNYLRVLEAMKLLAQRPQMPVYLVGAETGIADKSDFRKVFTDIYGTIPIAWRERFFKRAAELGLEVGKSCSE